MPKEHDPIKPKPGDQISPEEARSYLEQLTGKPAPLRKVNKARPLASPGETDKKTQARILKEELDAKQRALRERDQPSSHHSELSPQQAADVAEEQRWHDLKQTKKTTESKQDKPPKNIKKTRRTK